MRALTEEEIRKRAYELWKVAEQNNPYIKMDAFWYQAEKELLAERSAEESWSHMPNVEHRLFDDSAARSIGIRWAVTSVT
jgi:hypothetical protein